MLLSLLGIVDLVALPQSEKLIVAKMPVSRRAWPHSWVSLRTICAFNDLLISVIALLRMLHY